MIIADLFDVSTLFLKNRTISDTKKQPAKKSRRSQYRPDT